MEYNLNFKKIRAEDQIIFDIMPDPSFLFIVETNKIIINEKLIRLFRFDTKQDLIVNLNYGYRFFDAKEKSRAQKDFNKIVNFKAVRSRQYMFIRKDKTVFRGKVVLKALVSPKTRQPFGYFGTINDVKNEKIILKGVKKSFYNLLNDSSDTVIINDFNGNILKANKKFFQINFFAERSIKNLNLFQMIDKEFQEIYSERIEQLRMGNSTSPLEYRLIDDTGSPLYVEMNSQPIIYYNKKAIITRIRNISFQKEMEKKLFETIIQTEEKEKQGFAQDLHDELGPFLSGMKFYLDEIEITGKKTAHHKELVEYLRKMVDEAIVKTKIISNSLMSNILMDFGLSKALTSFVEKMNNIHQINIKLDIVNLDGRLNKILEIAIYRIIMELMNNSLKHANPGEILIEIKKENSFIKVMYKDDGKGFNIEKELKAPIGIGLSSIINRLKSNNAVYTFTSKINEGMQCEFKIPVNY